MEQTMTTPCSTPTSRGALDWLFAPLNEWSRLVSVAQELRSIDDECLDTLLQARASGPDPLSPAEAVKVRSLV